jgi:hypothetical protein
MTGIPNMKVAPLCSLVAATQTMDPLRGLGIGIASGDYMTFKPRFWNDLLVSAALSIPFAVTPVHLQAQDHHTTYHDKQHNDDHEWNNHEDQAYRIWAKQNHRKYSDFSKLKEQDQQNYWGWRHEHSDATLKIVIR